MIGYKAARAGVDVVVVSPRYTSQTCSRCLHLGVRPSQSKFQCRDCGYQINADLNGAKSIAKRHDLVAMGRYFCEYPWKEVKGARSGSSLFEEASSTKPETASSIDSASSRLDGVVDFSKQCGSLPCTIPLKKPRRPRAAQRRLTSDEKGKQCCHTPLTQSAVCSASHSGREDSGEGRRTLQNKQCSPR